MKYILVIFFVIASKASYSDELFYSEEVAEGYAKNALIEWSNLSGYKLNRNYLHNKPTILSGVDQNGKKIVMVLFSIENGSYQVTYTIDEAGYMNRYTVGASIYSIEKIKKDFAEAPFLPRP